MSGLEAAASAVAIATLAQQTAHLIGKIYNARRDADQLQSKIQNLSHLLKNIAHYLDRRNARHENRESSECDGEIDSNIQNTLEHCKSCVESIHKQFKLLVRRDTQRSPTVLIESLRFVRRHKYIAEQERDITMHLSTLSLLLGLLQYDERDEIRQQHASEQQNRQQWMQTQSDVHVDFLRQLFLLLQYVFQVAAQSQSQSSLERGAIPAFPSTTTQATTNNARTIDLGDPQPTLEALFGNTFAQQNHQAGLENYSFNPTHRVDDQDTAVREASSEDVVDVETIPQEVLDAELSSLSQVQTHDMSDYASENTLLLAVKSGSTELVERLIDGGAPTSMKDQFDWTLLHHAVFRVNIDMVDLLLTHEKSRCAEPEILNAQTRTKETALIYAVQRAHTPKGFDIAETLLDQPGCDVNISDGHGSALYYAVNVGKPSSRPRRSLVESLAEKEADVQTVYEQIPDSVRNYQVLLDHINRIGARQ